MSRTHRMYGFGICFGLGMILTFLSTLVMFNPRKFAIMYTFGNILSIFSTAFLVGTLHLIFLVLKTIYLTSSTFTS